MSQSDFEEITFNLLKERENPHMQDTMKFSLLYSTLNKITGFWLDERSTINPKLYSPGVPMTFLSEVDKSCEFLY